MMAQVPDFSLAGSDGALYSAKRLAGRRYVLYFYPKDDTPGCTSEACDFRDHFAALKKQGVEVFGVSPNTLEQHARFIAKHTLPFVLLADVDHVLAEALGVWGEKTLYGRTFMGIRRTTFLVDRNRTILQSWPKVKVTGHVADILAQLATLD
jgi:peroxiredoxin Q/BCP